MIAFNQRSIPNIVVLGDESRYEFLRWIIGGGLPGHFQDTPIWVTYGTSLGIEQHDQELLIHTTKCLPGVTMYFSENEGWSNQITVSKDTRFILFEQFPFRRDDTRQRIQALLRQDSINSMTMILMDLPRRHGSTDDTPSETGLIHSFNSYKADHVSVEIANDPKDVSRILNKQELFSVVWDRNIASNLQSLKKRIDDVKYDYEYDTLVDFEMGKTAILSLDTQEKICSFTAVQKYQKDCIWKNFEQVLYKIFFPKRDNGGLHPVATLYSDVLASNNISEPFAKKDSEYLLAELKMSLKRKISESMTELPPLLPQTKESYNNAIKCKSSAYYCVDIRFWNIVTKFVKEDIPSILVNRLNKRYQQLEETLR